MDLIEVRDILISWLVLSVAFMNLFGAISIESFLMFLFIIGFSVIIHEIAHREVARRLKFNAKYKAWPLGLVLALVTSFVGFLFAAPGAVIISPKYVFHESRERLREANFRISAAGPGTNIVLGAFSILLAFNLLSPLFYFAAQINIWLAIFNLLPIPPLDGSKVFYYNKKIWMIFIVVAIGLYLFLNFL